MKVESKAKQMTNESGIGYAFPGSRTETIYKNIVIALFMDFVQDADKPHYLYPPEDYKRFATAIYKGRWIITTEDLRFDSDWSWLMPVVNKIAEYRLAYPKQSDWVCECKIVILLKYLYREVFQFVKWSRTIES